MKKPKQVETAIVEEMEKLFTMKLGIRMDVAIAIMLVIDMSEEGVHAHTRSDDPKSDLIIHRGDCGLDRCSHLAGVIRGMFHAADEVVKEEEPDGSMVAYSTGSSLVN